jgi:hypothetical protein
MDLHGFTATPTLTQPRDPQTSDEFFRMDRWPGDPVPLSWTTVLVSVDNLSRKPFLGTAPFWPWTSQETHHIHHGRITAHVQWMIYDSIKCSIVSLCVLWFNDLVWVNDHTVDKLEVSHEPLCHQAALWVLEWYSMRSPFLGTRICQGRRVL